MGKITGISWTNSTWNPWHGCLKISEGCKYCYMYRDKERYGQEPTKVIRSSKATFNKPLSYKEHALVFTCSWSDFFIEEADAWRNDAWDIIKKTPHLTYQILTKRPDRILECLPPDWGVGYENVWIGVSAENQTVFEERVKLLSLVPAKVRFLSLEPLLGLITIPYGLNLSINWVIIGGESGNENGKYLYRPCDARWIYHIIVMCKLEGIPVFVKQMGNHIGKQLGMKDRVGGDISEFPILLQKQEFPKSHIKQST